MDKIEHFKILREGIRRQHMGIHEIEIGNIKIEFNSEGGVHDGLPAFAIYKDGELEVDYSDDIHKVAHYAEGGLYEAMFNDDDILNDLYSELDNYISEFYDYHNNKRKNPPESFRYIDMNANGSLDVGILGGAYQMNVKGKNYYCSRGHESLETTCHLMVDALFKHLHEQEDTTEDEFKDGDLSWMGVRDEDK